MNIEIKFRAFVKTQNRMINIDGFDKNLVYEQTFNHPSIDENIFEIEDCSLIEFTGFKEFEGKEIYEGDVLEYVPYNQDENKRVVAVEFDVEVGCWFAGSDALSDVLFEQHNEEWQIEKNYKPSLKHKVRVIGNIYENSELLIKK